MASGCSATTKAFILLAAIRAPVGRSGGSEGLFTVVPLAVLVTLPIGILGFGTIGREIARAAAAGTIDAEVVGVRDHHPADAREVLLNLFGPDGPPVATELSDLTSAASLVVEAAGAAAVSDHAVSVLDAGCDLMLLSVGALSDATLHDDIRSAARRNDAAVYVPSGAIAGLDAVKAAAVTGELEAVSLTTTKPPAGLAGAPYVEENDMDLDAIDSPTTMFEGSAREAAPAFPSNINVAMALSLAGIGPDRTDVSVVADPGEQNNVHRIAAGGGMGRIETTVRNVPSPSTPQTSHLAAASAIEKLRGLGATVRVGT